MIAAYSLAGMGICVFGVKLIAVRICIGASVLIALPGIVTLACLIPLYISGRLVTISKDLTSSKEQRHMLVGNVIPARY